MLSSAREAMPSIEGAGGRAGRGALATKKGAELSILRLKLPASVARRIKGYALLHGYDIEGVLNDTIRFRVESKRCQREQNQGQQAGETNPS